MVDWSFTFEVDFDTNPADTPSAWVDLSDRVRPDVRVTYGTPVGGSCTIMLNNHDRALDPTNPAAVYNLIPVRHARLTVTVGATTYPLWRGFVEEWPPLWPTYNQGLVAVTLVDATAWLALIDLDVDLPAQRTDERVAALLDLAGWPAALRDINPGVVNLDPYAQEGANALRVLLDTVDAEDSFLYVAPDGTVTFRSRHDYFDQTAALAVGGGQVPWTSVDVEHGGDGIVTVARAEMADGTVHEWSDPVGVANFGQRFHTVRDLTLPWYEATGLASWVVERFGQQNLWLENLRLHGNPHLADLLPLRPGHRVSFTHSAPPGGGTADYDGETVGLRHEISSGKWVTVLDLAPYFGDGPWFTWNDPAKGWNSGARWAP